MDLPKLKTIYLASPRGICAGVKRALSIVDLVLKKHGPPVYNKYHIVHNSHVISDFEKKGVIFVTDLQKVPDHSVIIFSAHGSAPYEYEEARKRKLILYDTTCPMVTKVHIEAKRYAKEGYHIIYIGKKTHQEGKGVMSEVPKQSMTFVNNIDTAQKINIQDKEKLIVLTQTTLSLNDTKDIIKILKKRFPHLILPPSVDICFSTQNRQNAVKELAKKTKLILVVGSKESSNSKRLKEVAAQSGAISYLIDDKTEIKKSWLKNCDSLGITAGASVPEYIINDIIQSLANKKTQIKEIISVKETTSFSLPKDL